MPPVLNAERFQSLLLRSRLVEVDNVWGTVIFLFSSSRVDDEPCKLFIECPWRLVGAHQALMLGSDDLRADIVARGDLNEGVRLDVAETLIAKALSAGGVSRQLAETEGLIVAEAKVSQAGDIRIVFENGCGLEVWPCGTSEMQWLLRSGGETVAGVGGVA